LISG
jgi:hypothetical protein